MTSQPSQPSQPATIPGYRLGDPTLAPAPYTLDDLSNLKAALLFGEDDLLALRQAGEILDLWYGFVGAHDFLLPPFASSGSPRPAYLARVRAADGGLRILARRRMMTHGWRIRWKIGRRHVFPGATSSRWFNL